MTPTFKENFFGQLSAVDIADQSDYYDLQEDDYYDITALYEHVRANSFIIRVYDGEPGLETQIGYCIVVPRGKDIAVLDSLHINEDYRDAGIGAEIMSRLSKRWSKISMLVGLHNEKGIRFYERLDYHVVTVVPNAFSPFTFKKPEDSQTAHSYADAVLMANYDTVKEGFGIERHFDTLM